MKEDRYPSAWQAFLLVLALFLAEVLASVLLVGLRKTLSLSRSELDVFATLLGNAMVFTYLVQKKGLSYRTLFHASRPAAVPLGGAAVPAPVGRQPGHRGGGLHPGAGARGDAVSRHHPARVPEPVSARQGDLRIRLPVRHGAPEHLPVRRRLPARPAQRLAVRAHAFAAAVHRALHAGYNSTLVALSAAAARAGQPEPADATLLTWVVALGGAALGAGILHRLLMPRPVRTRA